MRGKGEKEEINERKKRRERKENLKKEKNKRKIIERGRREKEEM